MGTECAGHGGDGGELSDLVPSFSFGEEASHPLRQEFRAAHPLGQAPLLAGFSSSAPSSSPSWRRRREAALLLSLAALLALAMTQRGAQSAHGAPRAIVGLLAANVEAASDPRFDRVWVPLDTWLRVAVDEGAPLQAIQSMGFEGCRQACLNEPRCQSFTVCGGVKCFLKEKLFRGTENTKYNPYCTSIMQVEPASGYKPVNPNLGLLQPSTAPLLDFYMYRAQGLASYPPANVNAASLSGVLWYLHNEVVCHCPRRFGITRIVRYRVKVRNTQALYNTGRTFGVRAAFDRGRCTGPWDCTADMWNRYGYIVGCNDLFADHFPFPTWKTMYPGAVWYSIPGSCPTRSYDEVDLQCASTQPGGVCQGTPTGQGNCTFSYEMAGEVNLDEVVGIQDLGDPLHKQWCEIDCKEYYFSEDGSNCTNWWRGLSDLKENERRIREVDEAFKRRYPEMPSDVELPQPLCDFDRHTFYPPTHPGYVPTTLEFLRSIGNPGGQPPWTDCVEDSKYMAYAKKAE